jgi:hypothetical protein
MNKSSRVLTALTLCSMFFLSGCATLFSKSTYPLSVNTHPAGSDITVTNQAGEEIFTGKTPARVDLAAGSGLFKRASYTVHISLEGYESKEVPVRFTLDRWYMANLFFNPVGLFIVDPLTGAMWKLDERKIDTVLVRTSAQNRKPALYFIEYSQIPEELKVQMVRAN